MRGFSTPIASRSGRRSACTLPNHRTRCRETPVCSTPGLVIATIPPRYFPPLTLFSGIPRIQMHPWALSRRTVVGCRWYTSHSASIGSYSFGNQSITEPRQFARVEAPAADRCLRAHRPCWRLCVRRRWWWWTVVGARALIDERYSRQIMNENFKAGAPYQYW